MRGVGEEVGGSDKVVEVIMATSLGISGTHRWWCKNTMKYIDFVQSYIGSMLLKR